MEIIPQNLHWLVPEEAAPCDIFLHFRGQNALGLSMGQPVSFEFLGKLAKAQYLQIYIRASDSKLWEEWKNKRHPLAKSPTSENTKDAKKFGNKRAEFISYFQKVYQLKGTDNRSTIAYKTASENLQKAIQSSMFDWYFNQFHEPPDLFQHSARICFAISFFCALNPLLNQSEIEDLLSASLIHELTGNLETNSIASEETITILEKKKHPVSQTVIELIRLQDELVSGLGFPKNLKGDKIPISIKVFSLFNLFHYRTKATGTRRARFDTAKKQMEKRKADFDGNLWQLFWMFWETEIESIS